MPPLYNFVQSNHGPFRSVGAATRSATLRSAVWLNRIDGTTARLNRAGSTGERLSVTRSLITGENQ